MWWRKRGYPCRNRNPDCGKPRIFGYKSMVASVNPATGKSVMYEWTGFQDITISMVDADPVFTNV